MRKISLIITTYNRPHLLPRAVQSAKNAGRNIEIVVVDDGSIDETAEVCRKLSGIKYVRSDQNLGVAGARNLGIKASSGDFIAFLDDDDLRLPGSFDRQLAMLEAAPVAGMIYGKVFFGDENCLPKEEMYPLTCPNGDVFWELLIFNFIPCQSVVFRRKCLIRTGMLDKNIPGIDDWDLWIRIAELYPVIAVAEPVAIWRQPTAASGQISERSEKLHRMAKSLHPNKWMKLSRARQVSSLKRRKAAHSFAESSAQQIIWTAASQLKSRRLVDFARTAGALLQLYPLIGLKLALKKSTRRLIESFLQKCGRKLPVSD